MNLTHCKNLVLRRFGNVFCLQQCGYKSIPSLDRPNTIETSGMELLRDPHLNKGMGFSLRERQLLGLHGLLPPAIMTQDTQARRVIKNLRSQPTDLARYIQLNALQDRNEKLFYRVLTENIEELLPIVYTPTVGLACQNYGFIFRRPKGLYITIYDNTVERIHNILCNWPYHDIKAIVVTDGERILGLGDLGACGMGIPVGKLSLYVALASVHPQWCLPIFLDVGTNNKDLLNDPFYTGIRQKRVTGPEYDKFIDNFMEAVVNRYGIETLIQFEDFANHNAFRLLERYKDKYCTFNDDIQGTASVALAGLMGACRLSNQKLKDQVVFFFGAGEAATGIALLTFEALKKEGLSEDEARGRIWMMDINGLLVTSRNDLDHHRKLFAKDCEHLHKITEVLSKAKPTCMMGASSVSGAFTEAIIKQMSSYQERPIIFALSNPTSRAECTAQQAYDYSDGKVVFASGSPFGKVIYKDKTFLPGQGNNAYVFPGIALAVLLFEIRHVTDDYFLLTSEILTSLLTQEQMDQGRVYPPLTDIKEISIKIAVECAKLAYKKGMANYYPEPEDKEKFIRTHLYDCHYGTYEPDVYSWPENLMKPF